MIRSCALICIALISMFLSGCLNNNREAQTETIRQETRQGVEAGKPVDVTTITRERTQEQSQAQTAVDVGPAIQAAVAGLRGDIPGLIRAAIPPAAPVDFTPILTRLDAQKPAGTDWATLASAGVAALGAGGYGLIKHRDAARQRSDADEARALNQRALAMLPPDQAARVLEA